MVTIMVCFYQGVKVTLVRLCLLLILAHYSSNSFGHLLFPKLCWYDLSWPSHYMWGSVLDVESSLAAQLTMREVMVACTHSCVYLPAMDGSHQDCPSDLTNTFCCVTIPPWVRRQLYAYLRHTDLFNVYTKSGLGRVCNNIQ